MATAPFQRKVDKCAYVFGTTIIVLYAYIIGKFPHTHIYTYATLLLGGLLMHRYYTYAIGEYKMYLLDFCYSANFLLLILLNFAPKCEWLLITCFLFSNGPLAAAIAAFRNSLVYHRVDMLTSLAIHAIPMTLTLHIRWSTVLDQADLPLDEQRFAPLPDTETWDAFYDNFFAKPIQIYLVWLVIYGVCNFCLTKDVLNYKLESSYSTFTASPAMQKKLENFPLPMPIIFLLAHFSYFLVLHLVSVLLFHCYWLNIVACIGWMLLSFFNGANYYMDYFSKKYETQLQKLSQLEEEVVSTPTRSISRQDSSGKGQKTSPKLTVETKKTQ